MASQSKSTGRVIVSALGSIPRDDDPRWMSVEDALKMADEMDVDISPTASAQKTFGDIAPDIWARHNAKPGQKAEPAARSRPAKQPTTLDEISADAWNRFNNPGRSRTQGER
jgi:hypothetical protein